MKWDDNLVDLSRVGEFSLVEELCINYRLLKFECHFNT